MQFFFAFYDLRFHYRKDTFFDQKILPKITILNFNVDPVFWKPRCTDF